MSNLNLSILAFSTKNSPNSPIFGIFNELLSNQNVNVARFARNVEWDIFCDFQRPWVNGGFGEGDGLMWHWIVNFCNLELGQLRGAAAIGVSLKSSKLFAAAAAAHNSSLEENNSEDASASCGEPEKKPQQPQSPLQPPSSSQSPIQQTASAAMVTFEDKTVFLESEAAAAAAASIMLQNSGCGLNSETLNIPAVLWDRPSGSSKRVPPPVPPRSPRRPYDHEASFAAATDVSRGDLRAETPSLSFFCYIAWTPFFH